MLPDIRPGNTKILYFFNCLLDGMHTKEQKDGTYIFHYGKYEEKVLKEDVENGIYEEYPIIKYNKK